MTFKKYWEIAKSQMNLRMAYNAWFWASLASSLMQLLVLYYFWSAVYQHSDTVGGMALPGMITYFILATLLNQFISADGDQLAQDIRSGNVAIELMRPYNLLLKIMAITAGGHITSFFRGALPVLIVAGLAFGINLPASWAHGALFLASAGLGILIGWQFDLMLSMVAFWTVNVWGIQVLRRGVLLFFTGALVPISLFPPWLKSLSAYLPFQSMVYVPVSIYTGTLSVTEALGALALQAAWLVVMFMALQLLWRRAVRSVAIMGG
jgi:ABC-2 type transport system permease protein